MPARRSDVTIQQVGDDTVLHDERAGKLHVINASAAWIWDQLDGAASVDDIGDRLAQRFGIEPAAARRDVERIARSFDELGLLVS